MNLSIRIHTLLTILLTISLAVISFYGAFDLSTYERDATSIAVQGIGQDFVDLFLIVPVLVISLIFTLRSSIIGLFIHSGISLYIVYSFFIYCFGVHFNNLFLWYCAVLGLSFYTFIIDIRLLSLIENRRESSRKFPVKSTAIYFLVIAVMFYTLWLKDIIPAIATDGVPTTVSDYRLLVNPVHVLDIALVLPGLIIAAFLLLRKKRYAFLLAPVLLIFIILMAIALIGMVIAMLFKGVSDESSVAAIFTLLAVAGIVLLIPGLKSFKRYE
ncbi:MAG: hypothetical protein KDF60_18025 [Calditrichaeota bacterium]|nr:hypothetical protein [Calditrichota bacterium]